MSIFHNFVIIHELFSNGSIQSWKIVQCDKRINSKQDMDHAPSTWWQLPSNKQHQIVWKKIILQFVRKPKFWWYSWPKISTYDTKLPIELSTIISLFEISYELVSSRKEKMISYLIIFMKKVKYYKDKPKIILLFVLIYFSVVLIRIKLHRPYRIEPN